MVFHSDVKDVKSLYPRKKNLSRYPGDKNDFKFQITNNKYEILKLISTLLISFSSNIRGESEN